MHLDVLGWLHVLWGAFGLLTGRPAELKTLLEPHNIEVVEMEPGETAR